MNRLALVVQQVGTLAAQGLGQEQSGVLLAVEGRRVELHELHVAHHRASPVGHGMSVARGHQRVGRASEHLAGPAAGQHDGASQTDGQLAFRSQRDRAHAAAAVHEQIDHELVLVHLHPSARGDHLRQGARHHAAGGVAAGMHDARHRVRAFSAQDEPAVALVELGTQPLQLTDAGRTLFHQHAHGLCRRRGPTPASRVSLRCNSDESCGLMAAAMPPCARKVVVWSRVALVIRPTFHRWAAPRAAVSPRCRPR